MNKDVLIPAIGQSFMVDLPTAPKTDAFKEKYPFEAVILDIDPIKGGFEEFTLLNKRSGNNLQVEKLWFDTEETGRTIKLIKACKP